MPVSVWTHSKKRFTRFGVPDILNTDQGCQFTSDDFTGVLKAQEIGISMDAKEPGATTYLSSAYGAA